MEKLHIISGSKVAVFKLLINEEDEKCNSQTSWQQPGRYVLDVNK